MRNWKNELRTTFIYEVEQESKTGGGVTINFFKRKDVAEAQARICIKQMTKHEKENYVINVNTWEWNEEEGEYEYVEGETIS